MENVVQHQADFFAMLLFSVLWHFIWFVIGSSLCLPVFTFDEDFLSHWYVLFTPFYISSVIQYLVRGAGKELSTRYL